MKRTRTIAKFFLILILVVSWVFSGWPPLLRNPRIPPATKEAQAATTNTIFLTTGTSWTVPSDWNSLNNKIEVIGGGGGGAAGGNGGDTAGGSGGGSGGGSAYSLKNNVSLTRGGTATIQIGSAGSAGVAGGDTFFNRTAGAAGTCADTVSACAKGGAGGSGTTGGAGGASGSGVGDTKLSGGNGGNGGANTLTDAGGGGGAGGAAGKDNAGANGVNGVAGSGAGAGGNGGNGGAGNNGANGGGAGGTGCNAIPCAASGNGGNGTDFDANNGTGGGGGGGKAGAGGGANNGGAGGGSGQYGGGGSGGGGGGGNAAGADGVGGAGGSGKQGLIVITYTTPETTLGDGADPANSTVAPGSGTTDVDAFTLQTNGDSEVITQVTLNIGVIGGVSDFKITNSDGSTVHATITSPVVGSNVVNLTTNITATNVLTTYKIRVTPKSHATMPAPPDGSYAITARVTAWTSSDIHTHVGSDTDSATITIDNQSPNGATATKAATQSQKITLKWTTSASSDFSRSVMLRWTGTTAGSDVPAEGTDYSVGDTIGTATVVCVRTTDAASATVVGVDGAGVGSCSSTALTNGQAYYYKIFQKDTRGNYDVGVAVTDTPFAPNIPTVIFLDTGTSWTVPSDWHSGNNTIELIGGGGGGAAGATGGVAGGAGGKGGGAGAYSQIIGLSLTPGASATIQVGAAGAAGAGGGDTFFNGASCAGSSACAKAGGGGAGQNGGGAGGLASSGFGDLKLSGGGGGNGGGNNGVGNVVGGGGGGGAGAGGQKGNGNNGSNNGDVQNGSNGGSGNADNGGAGGAGCSANPCATSGNGGAGAEFDSTHGSGGGGGGGQGGGAAAAGASGGTAGQYGAGGSGGGGGGSNSSGGAGVGGKQGLIVVTYTPHAPLHQNYYRFYQNIDNQTPTTAWGGLGENQPISNTDITNQPISGDVVRIRMSLLAPGTNIAPEAGRIFKLQYKESPCSSGVYTDIGAIGSSETWRGFDNASVDDGSALTTLKLSVSDIKESYEEANNSVQMPGTISPGEDGEWDWITQFNDPNGVKQGKTWCFRMTDTVFGALNNYINYPTIYTRLFTPEQRNWRWYGDEENETPTSALATENSRPLGVHSNEPIKLRLSIKETAGADGVNKKFRLQFSTASDLSAATNVVEIGDCVAASLWCYADGVDADDATISTLLLTDSDLKGRHNESGTSASTFTHTKNKTAEYEFTIKSTANVAKDTAYYFRAYDTNIGSAVPLATGKTYPFLKTFGPVLTFTLAGVNSGVIIDGFTTNITSTATAIPFGVLVPNVAKTAAQRLTVTQDGTGYTVYLKADGQLRTAGGVAIPGISGTNASPSSWSFNVNQTNTGAFGYHPDDDSLSGGSTRFQTNDTWAKVETTRQEIIFSSGFTENDIHDILYRVETSALQLEGSYTNDLQYIVVPTY